MPPIDPVVEVLVQNALDAAVEEGGLATVRAAGSPFLSGSSGIACAVFDRTGQQITQNAGGLLHVSALRLMQRELLKDFPVDTMADGDVFIFNDHFRGGVHCADVGMFRPIFRDGRATMFVATMMIVTDMGGMSAGGLPANATEIFHEGLVLPPLHYRRAGVREIAVEKVIRSNVRAPEKVMGDIDALMVGLKVATERVDELLNRYGVILVMVIVERLIDYGRRMTSLGIEAIPDGVYFGKYEIEGDGFDERRRLNVQCEITISGRACRMDFDGTDYQARGPINCSLSQATTGAAYALRCYLDPAIPMNEGFYQAFEVNLPEGSLLNPLFPAACNLRMGTVNAMVGAVNSAFAETFPERVTAGASAAVTATIGGAATGGQKPWAMIEADFGAFGARKGLDGVDGTPPLIYASPGWMRSIEGYELEFPLEYECFELAADSGGPGQWRGSAAVIKRLKILADGWLTVRGSDAFERGAPGLAGGEPGGLARWVLNEGGPDEEQLPPKKTNHYIKAGDRLTLNNGGGGGFGDPRLRDPEAVARDVRNGVVTREGALRDYGVELDVSGRNARRAAS
jgi:N-methylhydantoinase B